MKTSSILAVFAPVFVAASMASAETATYAGHITFDVRTGVSTWDPGSYVPRLAGDVYNNTNPTAPANFGFSSSDLTATYGDRVTTTGTGILDQNDFTIFNSTSGGNTGNVLTMSFNIALYNGTTSLPPSSPLASYLTGTVNFGAGLNAGQFTIITISGLSSLNFNINTTDVLMTQQVAAFTGTSTRLGIASLDPPTIGSSTNTMYINAAGTPSGYYNIGTAPNFLNANPGYRINLVPAPASLGLLGLGGLLAARRRR